MNKCRSGVVKSALLFIILLMLPASVVCINPTSKLKPAEFEVQDIYIYPEEVMPGDDVTITITIKNIGDVAGIYTVVLKMGQSDFDTYDLPVTANMTQNVDFQIEAPDSGIYQFSAGEMTKSLQVYDWQKYKIIYDNCLGSLGEWGFGYTFYDQDAGCSSYFKAPSKYFRVNKLTIDAFWRPFDLPDPEKHEFMVNIWSDEAKRDLLWSQNFPYSRFKDVSTLQDFEVPGVRTGGNFYVEIQPKSVRTETVDPLTGSYPPKYALFVALCVRTDNPNAGVTYKGSTTRWPENWPAQNESSFMIRVEGEGSPATGE
jgi:hypothetical protein